MINFEYDFQNGYSLIHTGIMNLLHLLIRDDISKYQLKASNISVDCILDSLEELNLKYNLKEGKGYWNIRIFLTNGFIYIIKEKNNISFLRIVNGAEVKRD